ncbi:PLP-dependent C-S lyase [Hyphodiscus hymeniophilus]|uniref:PLP-dependent C-S lyase n=1 Tax=Hyphodiscus hymeniophilus TaxID=353542 RepID=A0A9P6VM06_9HELO|nr:PLP-dependent C-S lyase [Hyphodiscus hymeniophilus]
MTIKPAFGRPMRTSQFSFAPTFTPVNHGSFGAYPRVIQEVQDNFQKQCHERPDTFIVYSLPGLIDESRAAIAPLLGVETDEVVLVPNATTGVNTVLRNLKWEKDDVVVFFSTIYDACEKTLASIQEHTPLETVNIALDYPVRDEEIVRRLGDTIKRVRDGGKNVRLAMFDTVLTMPGARMPWEELTQVCKEMGVLSLIDAAHAIGHIDLKHLGEVGPDFFVSNCHKWLYTPRACAIFYIPFRNQHLIRTTIPTSHGYEPISPTPPETPDGKTPFVHMFEFVATIDYSPYLCIPAALSFRRRICGGEEAIRTYCFDIARAGGQRTAEILGTEVMGAKFEGSRMTECAFANVKLPVRFESADEKGFQAKDGERIGMWINRRAVQDFDTYLQIKYQPDGLWVRLSGQIYLEMSDFEWVACRLKELCERVEKGEAPF